MATQVELIVNKSRALLGASYIDSSGMTYCQRFIRHCYEAAGLYGSAPSATEAGNKWIVSKEKDNIPVGAAVYFTNGNSNGHVGIYVGNGKMRHVWSKGKVCETEISVASGYRGWGWHGGKEPTGTGLTVTDNSDSSTSKNVELCSTSVVSTVNVNGKANARKYVNSINWQGGKYELHIVNNKVDYVPIVVGGVKWTTEWCDSPGQLSFTILKDSNLNITEGNTVIFKSNDIGVFYGYLFEKSKGKDGNIDCKAYDQLRYFKNKDTYCYKNRKYSDLLKLIANDYLLTCGDITDTGYAIPVRVEDNATLFDMLQYARKNTLYSTGKLYILYDDFGKLALKEVSKLKTDYWLTEKTAEDFKYKTSIDDNVYNRIQFYRDDSETGNRAEYIYQDGDLISKWGVLQNTIKLEDGDNPALYGKYLLNTYKQKKISLSVSDCFGDVTLRAGASLYVSLNVGDVVYDKALFFITKATHNFDKHHTCDLELAGQQNFVGEVS